jgi:hypothetical protein
MFRRFSANFAILSMAVDAGLTMLALVATEVLRPWLSPLKIVRPLETVRLPPISTWLFPSCGLLSS